MQTPDSPLGFDGGTVEASVFVRGGQARFPAIIGRVGVLGLFVAGKRARPLGRLRANSSLPVGVPAATNLRSVPADQVFALLVNVLGDLGQEVQGAEDLKVENVLVLLVIDFLFSRAHFMRQDWLIHLWWHWRRPIVQSMLADLSP